jgi:VWFA-related protein
MRAGVVLTIAWLGSGLAAQEPQTPRFRVAVDGVRIDAVVTDRKNNVVRDLRADDFEILQDGKPQKVTFAEFVPVATAPPPKASQSSAGREDVNAPAGEDGRRTFVIVVDDLGLSVEGINNIRKGLRRFVDTALLPADLAVLVRTGEARSLLQPLTNDRDALRAAIDALHYNTSSRQGVWPFGDVIQGPHGPEIEEAVSGVQRLASIQGTLAALNLVVQAARDLPGRKAVILASEGFPLQLNPGEAMRFPARDDTTRARSSADTVIDQAARSGVVIYAANGAALRSGGLSAADDYHQTAEARDPFASGEYKGGEAIAGQARILAAARRDDLRNAQAALEYLAEGTGGFAVGNTNDLAGAFARIGSDARGYYVIGSVPDQSTFAVKDGSPRLHTIVVNVKRRGVRVRTRKEFIGISDAAPSGPPTPAQQLVLAARSPFTATSIPMRATNLVGYAPGRGTFVRTVLHLDAHALTFATDANNTRTATVDLVGLVIDNDGVQVDTIATGFNVALENDAVEPGMKDGLVYTARVSIKKPGGYQLRYAVRDRHSGAVGSAGGFVNVPDVAGGAFAISGIVLGTGEHTEARWPLDSDAFSVPPADALQTFAPGSQLSFTYEVYNAGTGVQTVMSLWRDAVRRAVLRTDTLPPPSDGAPLIVAGRVNLPDTLPPGSYVLQLAATDLDSKQPKKPRSAVQRISLDVK